MNENYYSCNIIFILQLILRPACSKPISRNSKLSKLVQKSAYRVDGVNGTGLSRPMRTGSLFPSIRTSLYRSLADAQI